MPFRFPAGAAWFFQTWRAIAMFGEILVAKSVPGKPSDSVIPSRSPSIIWTSIRTSMDFFPLRCHQTRKLLENGPEKSLIFLARNLHSVEGLCLMKPEGTSEYWDLTVKSLHFGTNQLWFAPLLLVISYGSTVVHEWSKTPKSTNPSKTTQRFLKYIKFNPTTGWWFQPLLKKY